jgi:hypothetical protein
MPENMQLWVKRVQRNEEMIKELEKDEEAERMLLR